MRCKACNNPLSDNQQWWFQPKGVEERHLETLCLKCLSTIRMRPDIIDQEADSPLMLIMGSRFVYTQEDQE